MKNCKHPFLICSFESSTEVRPFPASFRSTPVASRVGGGTVLQDFLIDLALLHQVEGILVISAKQLLVPSSDALSS